MYVICFTHCVFVCHLELYPFPKGVRDFEVHVGRGILANEQSHTRPLKSNNGFNPNVIENSLKHAINSLNGEGGTKL